MVLTLRDYQEESVQAHYSFFRREVEGHPLFVVPTGGGKSLIISEFIKRSLIAWPSCRFIVLTHVRELIRQNYEEFIGHWGDDSFPPAGIYSAGEGRRDIDCRVLFAGIQSVFDKAAAIGRFDLVLIDEAHLVPKKGLGRYRSYLKDLRKINKHVRVCGYTATHFRLSGGYLHRGKDKMFTEVAHEVPLELLIEQGYLVPLVAKRPEHVIDAEGVATTAGDFKQKDLQIIARKDGCVKAAVGESVTIARAAGRKSWLYFAAGIEHARDILEELRARDVRSGAIFGHTKREDRDRIVRDFKDGKLTALVNVGVLTTGFNAPCCDMMAVMRPTKSAALYVQIMGRGMRTYPGKKDCLVLDYGCNVERHGPINKVRPKHVREADGEEKEPPPMKVCPECQTILMLGVKQCPSCEYEWTVDQINVEHDRVASWLAPVNMEANIPQMLDVSSWFFRKHHKLGGTPSLRVDILCGLRTITEWVCLEHSGFAGKRGWRWWSDHGGIAPPPSTVDDALERIEELRLPSAIEVTKEGKYDRVRRSIFAAVEKVQHDQS